MKIEQFRELQEAILYSIFFSEYWYWQFQRVETIIPYEIFWAYAKLAKLAYWKNYEDISMARISTDIVKEWLSEQMSQIMTTSFSFPSFYDDIKILLRKYIMEKPWDEFERLVELQQKFNLIEEKRASDLAKNYEIREIYDEIMEDLTDKYNRINKWLLLWYSTWFPILDKLTDWIQKGTIMRMNAYANTGKSKFSYHITNKLLEQGAKVIYFTLEVPKRTVVYNLIANKYKMPIWDVFRMKFDNIDFGELFTKKLEIVDDKSNLMDIIQYTEMRKPDAIIIDFVQNISCEWKSEYEEMTMVARKLQQLAIKQNIAIFDLSQISNEGAKADSDVIHSKWSGALVASADIALVMRRDTIKENWLVIKVAKNKFWMRKTLDFTVDYASGVWKEEWETVLNSKF